MELKLRVKINISPYDMMQEAIDAGVNIGYHRAFKHVDNPKEEDIIRSIQKEVFNELCNLLNFHTEEEGE